MLDYILLLFQIKIIMTYLYMHEFDSGSISLLLIIFITVKAQSNKDNIQGQLKIIKQKKGTIENEV